MKVFFFRVFRKLFMVFDFLRLRVKFSYSQCGEDLIAFYFFEKFGIIKPSYLDIGANDSKWGNNTYLFYLLGSKGYCIEPNRAHFRRFKRWRKRDIFINAGIGTDQSSDSAFYCFPGLYDSWNTFCYEDAVKKQIESGISFEVVQIPTITISDIITKYGVGKINFISIDAEGMDLMILKSIPFELIKPEMICIETIKFSLYNEVNKEENINLFLDSKGYTLYADTSVNSLFVKKEMI